MNDLSVPCPECNRPAGVKCITLDTHEPSDLVHRMRARKVARLTEGGEARERASEAWHQFLASAVSEGAEPHDCSCDAPESTATLPKRKA